MLRIVKMRLRDSGCTLSSYFSGTENKLVKEQDLVVWTMLVTLSIA